MNNDYKKFLLGLDKLLEETSITIVESVEAAKISFDPTFGAPLICINEETGKHAMITENGVEYP